MATQGVQAPTRLGITEFGAFKNLNWKPTTHLTKLRLVELDLQDLPTSKFNIDFSALLFLELRRCQDGSFLRWMEHNWTNSNRKLECFMYVMLEKQERKRGRVVVQPVMQLYSMEYFRLQLATAAVLSPGTSLQRLAWQLPPTSTIGMCQICWTT
jgi:hypothetical protein